MTVKEIISVYSNHASIRKIKNLCVPENKFDLPYAGTSDINKIIKSLNVNKAKRPDGICAKAFKMSVNVIDFHLANIINNDISLNKYSKHAKTATISDCNWIRTHNHLVHKRTRNQTKWLSVRL